MSPFRWLLCRELGRGDGLQVVRSGLLLLLKRKVQMALQSSWYQLHANLQIGSLNAIILD